MRHAGMVADPGGVRYKSAVARAAGSGDVAIQRILIGLSVVSLLSCNNGDGNNGSVTPPSPPPATTNFDCTAITCPELSVSGDAFATLTLPDNSVIASPWRGIADPALRTDPDVPGRLWLTYSWVQTHLQIVNTVPVFDSAVSIHVARSDDDGDSWTFDHAAWQSAGETNPADVSQTGYSDFEVSNISPVRIGSTTHWLAIVLRYFSQLGHNADGREGDSIHFRTSKMTSPSTLGQNTEDVLGFPGTDSSWLPRLNLSTLHADVADCLFWTEPALTTQGATVYLIAQCLKVIAGTTDRDTANEFTGVFKADAGVAVDEYDWQWVGKLTTAADAAYFGVPELAQPDLALSRDGTLLLIVTPKTLSPAAHLGCRVLEVESIDPPALRRYNGDPVVRASITSSDSSTAIGNGLCAYDPAANTGVLYVRGEVGTGYAIWRIHKTGLHP
jgi:hypothetical protein